MIWEKVQRDDPTAYGSKRMADERRYNLPFGDIIFSSEENREILERTEGMSANPFKDGGNDPNFSPERFAALGKDRFRPIDLALTLAQIKILGSLIKGASRVGIGSVNKSSQMISSGRNLVRNNIPDSMLSANQIVDKAYYKSYKGSQDITRKIDDVQADIEKVLDGQRIGSWITKKPSPELVKKLEDLQLEIANSTRKNNIASFRDRINQKIRSGRATKKEREVGEILKEKSDKSMDVVIAEAKPIEKRFRLTDKEGPYGKELQEYVQDVDDLAQLKKNLNYVEKRFPNLAGTPQAENLAKGLKGGQVTGRLFDEKGTLGAAKLNPDILYNKNVMAEIEANIIKAQDLIENKGRLPDGRYGQELLRDTVVSADSQYRTLYKLDDLFDNQGKYNFDKADEWLKTTWNPGSRYRALVDDAYGKGKSQIAKDSPNPFFKIQSVKFTSDNQGGGGQMPDGSIKSGRGGLQGDTPAGKRLGEVSTQKGNQGQSPKGPKSDVPNMATPKTPDLPDPNRSPDAPQSPDTPLSFDAPQSPDAPQTPDAPQSPDAPKSRDATARSRDATAKSRDASSRSKRDEGKKKDEGESKSKRDEGKKKRDGESRRSGKKKKVDDLTIKRKTKGKKQKPKRKVRKKRVRLGDSDSTTTPNIDVQSKIAAPKRFASKIQWKENNKYYQFNFNNKKITRTDKPIGSGVKKGNTPGETVKIIETQTIKPRYQKAVLGRIEIRLQSPNSVALKNLPNYKTITKVSNFRR